MITLGKHSFKAIFLFAFFCILSGQSTATRSHHDENDHHQTRHRAAKHQASATITDSLQQPFAKEGAGDVELVQLAAQELEVRLAVTGHETGDEKLEHARVYDVELGQPSGATYRKMIGPELPATSSSAMPLEMTQAQEEQMRKVRGLIADGAQKLMEQDPDFWGAISYWKEAQRFDADLNKHARRTINVLAGTGAVLASLAIGDVYFFNVSIWNMLRVPLTYSSQFPPSQATAFGTVVLALGLPDMFLEYRDLIMRIVRGRSEYAGLAEERSTRYGVLRALALGPGLVLFAGKSFFGYVHANQETAREILPAVYIAGAAWGLLVIKKAYGTIERGVTSAWRALRSCIAKRRGRHLLGEEKRTQIRHRLAGGMRKLLDKQNQDAVYTLGLSLLAIEEFVEETTRNLRAKIEKLSAEKQAVEDDVDVQIVALQNQMRAMQRFGDLYAMQLLYGFDRNDEYSFSGPSAFKEWLKEQFIGYGEPAGLVVARNVGRVVGYLGVGALWYAWGFAANSLGIQEDPSYGLGATLTAIYVPYIAERTGAALEGVMSYCMGYNKTQHREFIEDVNMDLRGLRSTVAVLNFVRSVFAMWQTSGVALSGMGLGFGENNDLNLFVDNPSSAYIEPAAWATLAPNMVGYGAVEQGKSNPRLQAWISGLAKRHGKDFHLRLRQHVSSTFGHLDQFVQIAQGRVITTLYEKLRQSPETWVQANAASGV